MSLFIRENPFSTRNNALVKSSLFDDDFENEFFNHPLVSFNSLYPYHHKHPFKYLNNQIEKAFNNDLFKSMDFTPKINLSEDEKNYYVHADLPGLSKEQVKMELSDDNRILTISGERKTIIDNSEDDSNEKSDEDCKENDVKKSNDNCKDNTKENKEKENTKKYSRIECSYGKFSRSFTLPENVDYTKIQAKMENGALEINLPKIESSKQEQRKTIQIQ